MYTSKLIHRKSEIVLTIREVFYEYLALSIPDFWACEFTKIRIIFGD